MPRIARCSLNLVTRMLVLDLDQSTQRVLEHFPPEIQASQRKLPSRPGFSGAVVLHVVCEAGEFGLRGWPPGSAPAARIVGLHRLLAHIAECGVTQVSVPIPTRDGTTLIECDGRFWHLEPWMPGEADYRRLPSRSRLSAMMRCLADWHRAAAEFHPNGAESEWFASSASAESPAVVDRLRRIRRWQSGDWAAANARLASIPSSEFRELAEHTLNVFAHCAENIASQLRTAAAMRVRLQPCLRDIRHDHVLFSGEEVTGLIDPAACRSETVAADLARHLGSVVGDDSAAWDFALSEYRSHAPLTIDQLALIPILDRSGVLLSGMNWLYRFLVAGAPCANLDAALERLRFHAQRFEGLQAEW